MSFPYIETIADVLPFIEGRKEFTLSEKNGYIAIDYQIVQPDTFFTGCNLTDSIRRECRGIIFDKDGYIIRRPFHKFFNLNENEETQLHKLNFDEPHIIEEKIDGSMIGFFICENKPIWGTKLGHTPISPQIEKFVKESPIRYKEFATELFYAGYTTIFEWCSRQQQIVLDYPADKLVLLAIRHIKSGEYLDIHNFSI